MANGPAFLQNLPRSAQGFPANQVFVNGIGSIIAANSLISLDNATFNSSGQLTISALATANSERVGYVSVAVPIAGTGQAILKGQIDDINTDAFVVGNLLKVSTGTAFARATASTDNAVAKVIVKSATVGRIFFDGYALNKEIVPNSTDLSGERYITMRNSTSSSIGAGVFVPIDLTLTKVNGAIPINATIALDQQFCGRTQEIIAVNAEGRVLIEGPIRGLNLPSAFFSDGDQLKIKNSSEVERVASGADNVIGEVLNQSAGDIYFNGQHIDFHPAAIVHDYGFLGFDAEFNGGSANTDSDFPNITIAAAATSAKLGFVGLTVGGLTPFGLGETISNTTTGTFRVVSAGRYRIEVPELRYAYNTTATGSITTSITMTGRTSSGVEVDLYTIHDDLVLHAGTAIQTNIVILPRVIVADLAATDTIRFYMNIENGTASSITLTNNSAQNFIEFRAAEVSIELLQLL